MVEAASRPVALVTGGAKRIGRAIVEDLAAHGWAVAIHYHYSHAEADALSAALRERGTRASVVEADLADVGGLDRVIAEASAALGPVTLLVNNASIFERDTVGNLDLALYERQMAVNLTAPVFLADAFAKRLPAGVEGNVINVLDQRIWRPTPRHFSYQISKSALATATMVLAQALAPRIRVNGIAPGSTIPNIREGEADFRRKLERLPLGHGPDLADFGRSVRYLVENRSITGQIIGLDSGQHLAFWSERTSPFDG